MPPSSVNAIKIIEEGKYQEAITLLKLADSRKPKDADLNNLLGFSHRKTGDLEKARAYYRKARRIGGKHKGAIEYQGELFLLLGNKSAAEDNLRKLDHIFWLGFSELDDLRTAIKKFKT